MPQKRAVLVRLALILPAFVAFAAVAAKPILTDTHIGPNSMLLLAAAMGYLAACCWFSDNEAVRGRLALASWAILLSGAVAGGVLHVRSRRSAPRSVDAVQDQWDKYVEAEPWFDGYREEFRLSARMEWYPYVMWRRRPFTGRYINVDATGRRRTWNPSDADPGAPAVFVLGGSAAWGNGARDDHTIPSDLSRLLAGAGHRARVTNYAELGFVSTQNLITLVQELRNGNVPDVLVCYDGVNDLYAALQSREAGVPQLSPRLKTAMNGLFDSYYQKVTGHAPGDTAAATRTAPSDDELLERTVALYLGNLRVINRLAQSAGFKALFFWQPVAFVNKPLSTAEVSRIDAERRVAGEFFKKAYARMATADTPSNFHDLSDVFSATTDSIYFDFCHTTEQGNRLIALRIAQEVQKLVDSSAGGGLPAHLKTRP